MDRGKMPINKEITIQKDKIAKFCKKHHINQLSIYGSALRDDFKPESDIDVLIEFDPNHVPSFFKLFEMEAELSVIFGGRKVDSRTPQDLSRYFRDKVMEEAESQYVQR
ncbi:MAG: nucleotidyltransferase family protein [Candidatus Aminicenantaceae bacterium]